MRRTLAVLAMLLAGSTAVFSGGAPEKGGPVELTVATVNNPDMLIMQQLSSWFTRSTHIRLNFVVLPENELRQKVTEDVGLGFGRYEIVIIGTYDASFSGKTGWVVSTELFLALLPKPIRDA